MQVNMDQRNRYSADPMTMFYGCVWMCMDVIYGCAGSPDIVFCDGKCAFTMARQCSGLPRHL